MTGIATQRRVLLLGLALGAATVAALLLGRDTAGLPRAEPPDASTRDTPATGRPMRRAHDPGRPSKPWSLRGRVTTAHGAPVAGAMVDTAPMGSPWDDAPPAAVLTDDDGRYEIDLDPLRADRSLRAYVQVAKTGYQPGYATYAIDGHADRALEWTRDVRLGVGTTVTGRVVDDAGRPLSGANAVLGLRATAAFAPRGSTGGRAN